VELGQGVTHDDCHLMSPSEMMCARCGATVGPGLLS